MFLQLSSLYWQEEYFKEKSMRYTGRQGMWYFS